jgi:predicted 3-demethylubiquinone-9 3-methyltransferase (glyoxalase superfamily)
LGVTSSGCRPYAYLMATIRPFLMFTGQAQEALEFYVSLFPGSEVLRLERFGADGAGVEGTVSKALFRVADQEVMAFDSPPVHDFGFTPAISLFVTLDSAEELDGVFAKLAEGGKVLMPVDNYGFSPRFGWVQDRFGVSWQLNLAG